MRAYVSRPADAARRRRVALGVLVALLLGLVALAWLRVGAAPAVEIQTSVPGIGPSTEVIVVLREEGRGLDAARLELVQGERTLDLGSFDHQPRPFWALWGPRTVEDRIVATAGRDSEGLEEGTAILRVTAERAGTWLRRPDPVTVEREVPVRFRAPSIQVLSNLIYAAQGGSEAVVYRVGEGTARHGVRAGEYFFPGFALPGGDAAERFVLFGVPYDLDDSNRVRLVVADELGTEAEIAFLDRFFPKSFRHSTIELGDPFLERVVPAIVAQTPGLREGEGLLDTYLSINRDLRRENGERLVELTREPAQEFLWREPFLQQPNTQVMDQFAAYRTYTYEGREVDRQVHLGFDLASTRRADVLAANRGRVVLAEYLGIYGNTVVLDHGYGLFSLYAHLSAIEVEPGRTLERSEVIGQSGETGLAGGDHLHFTTLIRGLPVNPAEWFDGHWIQDRLEGKLGAALPFE